MILDPHTQVQKIDFSRYGGEWIAICNSEVISHGEKIKEVFFEAKKKLPYHIPHLLKVPGKETWIF